MTTWAQYLFSEKKFVQISSFSGVNSLLSYQRMERKNEFFSDFKITQGNFKMMKKLILNNRDK